MTEDAVVAVLGTLPLTPRAGQCSILTEISLHKTRYDRLHIAFGDCLRPMPHSLVRHLYMLPTWLASLVHHLHNAGKACRVILRHTQFDH